jgi:membrane-associated phospholipid phosphatase
MAAFGRPLSTACHGPYGGTRVRAQRDSWQHDEKTLLQLKWLEDEDLDWQPDRKGFDIIGPEIEQLKMLMQDDRQRYLDEAEEQADGLDDYFIHFIGASSARCPWTIELVSAGLAIGNVAYMHYKAKFRRVRSSFLCPGLVPPFGPPAHPSFPSGHSFAGHFIALLLLEIPGINARYGIFAAKNGTRGGTPEQDSLEKRREINSPMLWLAQRLAKNRERIGVHYASDSSASRHLAAGIWWALLRDQKNRIVCPTLDLILNRAQAEWA